MTTEATRPTAQVVCSAFVGQYYTILHNNPDQAVKFYNETSRMGRAGPDGILEYVTTSTEINTKILAMDFSKYTAKIESADSMLSLNDAVLIVVIGSLYSGDVVCKRFTQTFFLAPQATGGYFVLSDIFRILPETNQDVSDTTPAAVEEPVATEPVAVVDNAACGEPLKPTVNSTTVENNPTVNGVAVENNVTVKSYVKVAKEGVKKAPVAAAPPAQKDIPKKHPVSAPPPPPAKAEVVKKTYASIVKDNKEVSPAVKPMSSKPVSKPPTKVVEESAKPSQAAEITPASTSATKSNTSNDEEGHSVFVRGLPSRSTVKMVGEEFQKFGAIKAGGIQVRNNKFDEFCFGFVEFESQKSMQAAIEASPIFISEREVFIEKKRTSTRVVNGVVTNAGGDGRFQYARGAESFRGQGGGYVVNNANYRGADNFNRSDGGGEFFNRRDDGNHYNRRNDGFRYQNEFSGRGNWSTQGNGYHQNGNGFHQNGNGRYAPVNRGPKQTPVAAPVNSGPKQTPVAAPVKSGSKQTPVAAPVKDGPKQTPVAAPANDGPKQTTVAAPANDGPKQTPVAAPANDGPKQTPVAAPVNNGSK